MSAALTRAVVYVEDEPANVVIVERLLARRPALRCVVAPDGASGIRAVRDADPLLVLLDLHLPDMPGEEVLAALRADPRTAGVPVVVCSADAQPERIAALRAAGASAYLTKPLDLAEVLRVVDAAVSDEGDR